MFPSFIFLDRSLRMLYPPGWHWGGTVDDVVVVVVVVVVDVVVVVVVVVDVVVVGVVVGVVSQYFKPMVVFLFSFTTKILKLL